jgi:DNA-binding NarL/FixJ family response regulator
MTTIQRKCILLVDDHPIMIEGMRALVSSTPDMKIIGTCSSLDAALEHLQASLPDLIMMDISIEGPNGLVATQSLSVRYPRVPILVCTCNDATTYTPLAVAAGARGLVTKDQPDREILLAIRTVLQGHVYPSPRLPHPRHASPERLCSSTPSHALTPREWVVVDYLAQGFSTLHMAQVMNVSQKTIETHRLNIRRKLDIGSQSDLVRWAICRHAHQLTATPPPDSSPANRPIKP